MSNTAKNRIFRTLASLKSSHFIRDIAVVGGGIAVAQAITLAFTPFITRLYGPESFGIYAAFTAIVSIISPLATFGYANAIVMPKDDSCAAAVVRLSVLCGLILAVLSLFFVHLTLPWLSDHTGLEQSPYILYLIPASLLVSTFFSVADQAAIRNGIFKTRARAYVESTFGTNIAKLVGGLSAPSGLLLIVLTLGGRATNILIQLARSPKTAIFTPNKWLGLSGVFEAARTHKDFALYRMPQSILSAASLGLPVIFLSSMFGTAIAGQYSLAATVLAAPVMLLGQTVGDVFYPKITRAIVEQAPHSLKLLKKATLALSASAIIPFGVISIYGDIIFPLIFGQQWIIAGEYAQWMSIWLASTLASRAAVAALPALKLQKFLLIREIFSLGLRGGALYIGFSVLQSHIAAVALFSIAGILANIPIIYKAHSCLAHSIKTQDI